MQKKPKMIVHCFIFAVLLTSALGIQTANAISEYTANPYFVKSQGKWDRYLYWFNWAPPWNDGDCTDANGDGRCDSDPDNHYILWTADGLVKIKSRDQNSGDTAGISARFGQGEFHGTPSHQQLLRLDPNVIKTLYMEGRVASWGCTYTLWPDWNGIKFDAWARNIYTSKRLMVEMYWFGYGWNDPSLGDIFRLIGSDLYDYVVKLSNHPESVTQIDWASNDRTYMINLLDFFKYAIETAIRDYNPSEDSRNFVMSNWELYHVAIDVETGDTLNWNDIQAWVDAKMLKVTYGDRYPPYPPSTPSGPSSGYRWTSYTYKTSTMDPDDDLVRYQFDWGDGSSTWTGYYNSGATASASHSWNNIGSYIVRVRAIDVLGQYSDWSPNKKVNIIRQPGFPCPTLFVWNGSEYVEVDVLDIHGDSDITFLQGIEQTLVPENHLYKLSLRELDEFTSHIDYVKLYAVDNDVEKHESHLVQAVHSELGHVESLLLRDDGRRVNLNPLETIDLKFTVPNTNDIAYFIFEINGYNIKL